MALLTGVHEPCTEGDSGRGTRKQGKEEVKFYLSHWGPKAARPISAVSPHLQILTCCPARIYPQNKSTNNHFFLTFLISYFSFYPVFYSSFFLFYLFLFYCTIIITTIMYKHDVFF